MPGETPLQRFDDRIALLDDLVLGFEDLLPLAALLFLQFLDLLLNLALLFERDCLARLPPQRLDLFLDIRKRLLGEEHHVVGPLLQLLSRLVEVDTHWLSRPAGSCRKAHSRTEIQLVTTICSRLESRACSTPRARGGSRARC
jgi:hypothetical protein